MTEIQTVVGMFVQYTSSVQIKCPDNLYKHRAWLTLESPRDARCFIISGIDQIFELNKLCLLKKVIEGQAP